MAGKKLRNSTAQNNGDLPSSPTKSPKSPPKSIRQWDRSLIEVKGRLNSDYRASLGSLVAQSYAQIGKFEHSHENYETSVRSRLGGVACVEFDNQGKNIVSVTRAAGCLSVHSFESLYCQSSKASDESKLVMHWSFPKGMELNMARWNPSNQNEVACITRNHDRVLTFDIRSMSLVPTAEWRTLSNTGVLSDVAITTVEDSRIFSSDTLGRVHMWDRRVADVYPRIQLSTNRNDYLNSIELYVDNQTIFGAGREGIIYVWDIRRGTGNVSYLPLTSLHLQPMMKKIASLPVRDLPLTSLHLAPIMKKLTIQDVIVPREILSIDVNQSAPSQLAFHMQEGWSGVLDIYKSEITHVHRPPPIWYPNNSGLRRGSWLPRSWTYVVGCPRDKGIYVIDFHPSLRSPCYIDYEPESEKKRRDHYKHINRYVSLSETVTSCAAHPLNSSIVAGTEKSSLLLIGQRHHEENEVQPQPNLSDSQAMDQYFES